VIAPLLLAVIVVSSAQAQRPTAQPVLSSPQSQSVMPEGVAPFRRLEVKTQEYRIKMLGTEYHGTQMSAAFETDSVASVDRYGLVQFVRGCQFRSCPRPGGGIGREVTKVLPSFHDTVPWLIPDWIVDSNDADPLYNSWDDHPEEHRLGVYRWNQVPGSFDEATELNINRGMPSEPRLYVRDSTKNAYYDQENGCAQNFALEFRVCAYGLDEIPRQSTRENVGFARPLACLEWGSSYVYDHALRAFTSPQGLASCQGL
jgi:hypothetical protein